MFASYTIEDDREFSPEKIGGALPGDPSGRSVTGTLGGFQVSGCILLPWAFLTVQKTS